MAYANNPRLISSGNQSVGELDYAGEATGQSFLVGELVYKDAAGQWTACASDAVVIWGQARQAATGTQGTSLGVQRIMPHDKVEFVCSTTVTAANEGIKYALVVSSNLHKIDLTDTDHDAFTLVEGVKDVYGNYTTRAICSIVPTVAQASSGT